MTKTSSSAEWQCGTHPPRLAGYQARCGYGPRLPFIVISEMMGIPEGRDRNDLRVWSGAVVKTFDPIITKEDTLAALRQDAELAETLGQDAHGGRPQT